MARKLRIALVASGDPRLDSFQDIDSGGTGPIWRLGREFADRGHEVKIYSSTHSEYKRWTQANVDVVELPTIEFANKIDWVFERLPFSQRLIRIQRLSTTPGEMVERLFGRLRFSSRAAKAISNEDPDVVYLRDRISAFFPARLSQASVFTVSSPDACDFYYESAISRHPFNRVLFRYKRWIEESVLDNTNEIISMNTDMKRYFEDRGYTNISTITLGVDENEFVDLTSREEKSYVLYVGRLDGNKRPEWVLDAFLHANTSRFELHFVGSGPREPVVREQVSRSDREDDIKLHGHMPRREVLTHMQQAAVFVLPSEFESCSNVIVEAMASGCPVIASDTMGARELISDNKTGILFDKNNKSTLCGALDQLLEDKSRREQMSKAAHKRALKRHTATVIADKYLEVGRQAIRQSD